MFTPSTYLRMLTLSTHISGVKRSDRSSRRAPDARPYHHGDLRQALVRAAIDLLRTQGPEALTLRGVARAAGVSQTAPYRHFADRRDLVAAVAQDGFERMGAAMIDAMTRAEGRLGLKQVALTYVQFAHAHPAEYRIMFGPEVAHQQDLPALRGASHGVLDFVARGIAGLQQAGVIDAAADPHAYAVAIWSMLHGLVMLSLDEQTTDVVPLEKLVETSTHIMMFGMAKR
jgi:AcrR family transcriptional regulator